MRYRLGYDAPIGHMAVDFTEEGLLGLSFSDETLADISSCPVPLSKDVKEWLDAYFRGEETRDLSTILDVSSFTKIVLEAAKKIGYGETSTYKGIGDMLKEDLGIKNISYRAIGRALHYNPIVIYYPCHRIVKSDGHIGDYKYGTAIKKWLLEHEGITISSDTAMQRKNLVSCI